MKRLAAVLVLASLILATPLSGQAAWTGAASIRAETFYVPSSGLTLGAWTTVRPGTDYEVSGFGIANDFQINLEYQAGILDADIANLNTYLYPANPAFPPGHTDGTWTKNYSDNEEYVLNVNAAGGLTIYEFEELRETVGGANIQWTLTAWHQTILAGDIVGNTLRVLPTGTYRPFVGDPDVNNVEVFDGNLDTEVLGYTFTGAVGDIGEGDSLGVQLVPEPATIIVWSLLGLTAVGYGVWRRKRAA